jgi:O-methyltransferase
MHPDRRQAFAYLTLLEKTLTRFPPDESDWQLLAGLDLPDDLGRELRYWIENGSCDLTGDSAFDPELRRMGRDWPAEAETMIGLARLDNLRDCIADVFDRSTPGDLLEAGVWRGGACIFMRAVLEALGDRERQVWVADSFRGLPQPDPVSYPADAGVRLWTVETLAVPLGIVRWNFERYGLLDGRVRFLPGWFRDTLPSAPVERLAVLRLDGDLYESTIVALRSLYPKLSPGGYVIVDDYGAMECCRQAVEQFRLEAAISEPLREIDWTGVFWRKNR